MPTGSLFAFKQRTSTLERSSVARPIQEATRHPSIGFSGMYGWKPTSFHEQWHLVGHGSGQSSLFYKRCSGAEIHTAPDLDALSYTSHQTEFESIQSPHLVWRSAELPRCRLGSTTDTSSNVAQKSKGYIYTSASASPYSDRRCYRA